MEVKNYTVTYYKKYKYSVNNAKARLGIVFNSTK